MSATVTASLTSDGAGPPRIELTAFLPRAVDAARVAQAGPEPLRTDAHEAAAAKREVAKFKVLGDQIRTARQRVASAELTFKKVRAAKDLLECDPEPDLANKLRKIEGELVISEQERASAIADLALIEPLAAPVWPAAANSVAIAVTGVLDTRQRELWHELEAAQQAVDGALVRVREVVEKAVRETLLGPLAELRVLQAARDRFDTGTVRMLEEIRTNLVGPPPAGVWPTDANHRFWKAPDPIPVAAPDRVTA